MTPARLAGLYLLFAALATGANLCTQAALRAVAGAGTGPVGAGYWAALIGGTGVGLVVKYLLDRRWIFGERSAGAAAHARQFPAYTLTGVATTAIFWVTQTGAYLLVGSAAALYAGGALGLAVGYAIKYRLDRRFVFGAPGRATA